MVYSRNCPHDEAERNVLQSIFFRPWEAIGCRAPGAVAVAEDVDVTSCDVTSFRFSATVMKIEATLFPGIHRHFKFQCFTFFVKNCQEKVFFGTTSTQGNGFSSQSIHFLEKELLFLLKNAFRKTKRCIGTNKSFTWNFLCLIQFFSFFSIRCKQTKQYKTRIVSEANERTNESGFHWEQNLNECLELHFTV